MIKVTSVAKDGLKAKSVVAMVAALAAGERDPRALADLAKGPLRGKRDQLAEALDGMFDSHHGVIARALLDQVPSWTGRSRRWSSRRSRRWPR